MIKIENYHMPIRNSLSITDIPPMLRFHKGDYRHSLTSIFLKRAIDLIVSVSVITVFAPCFAMLIILVALDAGPVFYAQRRIGRGGRTSCVGSSRPWSLTPTKSSKHCSRLMRKRARNVNVLETERRPTCHQDRAVSPPLQS